MPTAHHTQPRNIAYSLLAGLLICLALPVQAKLPTPVLEVLKEESIPANSIGVIIQPVDSLTPLLSHNPETPFNPASVIKIVTTYAALEMLGPDYQWKTEFYLDGPLKGDVLFGNLIAKGYGDPYLIEETLLPALRELRHRGLKNITGKLGIDNSYFEKSPQDPGEFDNKPYRTYNANPSALMTNFQATHFTMTANGSSVNIETWPHVPRMKIKNEMKLVSGHCHSRYRWPKMWFDRQGDYIVARFAGKFSERCGQVGFHRAVADPEDLFYGAFKSLWDYLGGTLANGYLEMTVPDDRIPYYRHDSKPLSEVIRLINKHSNNVMTKQLLLTIGAEAEGAPGTYQKGRDAVHRWLQQKNIDTAGLYIDNGSGLSRDSRISAKTLSEILQQQWHSSWMPEIISSLAILSRDGTGKKRFHDNPLQGQMHLKTGIIDHVRAMAGFYHATDGKRYIVVSLQNHPEIHMYTGTKIQDALLRWLDDTVN